ncbi:restriction endonuclease subunit S [Ezakiella coagulans]|uniref:restriction endonuclease subunit S n=1 Tax=Finegoldia magna TaxID=1260 RepID=UPI00288AD8DA|nr:restriction endonuclease subunit S [Ezakiella coagulans]
MSRLEELIQKLCPNGVEYKEIKDIANVSIGEFVHKNKQNPNAEYPVFNGGITNTGFYDEFNRTANKIIISARGANAGFVNRVFSNFWSGNSCYTIDVTDCTIDWNFLYYWLKSKEQKLLGDQQRGGIPAVSKKQVERFITPVPPLEVQREIVRILDSFTLLTAELTAELTARKKQYEYYQNALMDFTDRNVQYKSVGELFEIKNGLNKQKDAFGKGQPIINFTDVYNKRWLAKGTFKGLVDVTEEEIKRYSAKKGDVFFTRTSETKEDIGMSSTLIEDIPNCVFSGFVLRARPITDLLLPKFCSYYFSTNKVRDTIIRYAAFTTRATTTGPKLSKIMVPILSIEEQQRIVKILDRFDSLCNDITTGLPAEIEARQKQYEFYRDKLLSFKQL